MLHIFALYAKNKEYNEEENQQIRSALLAEIKELRAKLDDARARKVERRERWR